MRRSRFRSTDPTELEGIMGRCEVGHLGVLTPDGFPRPVPVSFAWHEGRVVLHGARSGEKFAAVAAGLPVAFSASLPYSLLTPLLLGHASACETTQLYKSVLVRGTGMVIDDAAQAFAALDALMRKYDPTGEYEPLSPENLDHRRALGATAVFAIQPSRVDVRICMGQQWTAERRAAAVEALQRRGTALDLATAREIARYAPSDQEDLDP